MVGATLLGLFEEEPPGRLKTTFFYLLPLRRPTLESWLEVVFADPRLLAETLLTELTPEGLPLDSNTGSTHSWALDIATREWWLVLGRLLKPLGFSNVKTPLVLSVATGLKW